MSGKSKKNSKILIKLNGKELGNTQTNEDGIYTYKLTGISQQSNTLSASILDGTNAVIGTVESSFSFGAKMPTYYTLSVTPSKEVSTSTGITFLVDAEPSLTEVSLTIDSAVLIGKESSPGKYTVSTISPAKAGSYPVQVSLKNILAQVTTKTDAAILTVTAPLIIAPPQAPKVMFKNVVISTE